jgi:hypothetical protein
MVTSTRDVEVFWFASLLRGSVAEQRRSDQSVSRDVDG